MNKRQKLILVIVTGATLLCAAAQVGAAQQNPPGQAAANNQTPAGKQTHRQKMPHDERKAAANRLKQSYQAQRAKAMDDYVKAHGNGVNVGGGK